LCLYISTYRAILLRVKDQRDILPWLRRLVADVPARRPGLDPGSFHVGFVVDKVALGHVFPRGKGKVKVKFSVEQAMKAQRGSRGIALVFI
jgi:hypothetical protein